MILQDSRVNDLKRFTRNLKRFRIDLTRFERYLTRFVSDFNNDLTRFDPCKIRINDLTRYAHK